MSKKPEIEAEILQKLFIYFIFIYLKVPMNKTMCYVLLFTLIKGSNHFLSH